MTSMAPALRPSPCPSDQQELASRGRSPVTRAARPRHGTGLGRAEARDGPRAAAAEGRLDAVPLARCNDRLIRHRYAMIRRHAMRLRQQQEETGLLIVVYFISDHDPSGL